MSGYPFRDHKTCAEWLGVDDLVDGVERSDAHPQPLPISGGEQEVSSGRIEDRAAPATSQQASDVSTPGPSETLTGPLPSAKLGGRIGWPASVARPLFTHHLARDEEGALVAVISGFGAAHAYDLATVSALAFTAELARKKLMAEYETGQKKKGGA